MGAKPVIQLNPFIATKNSTNDVHWLRNIIWFFIFTNMKRWSRKGTRFDLPVIADKEVPFSLFADMKIDSPEVYARVSLDKYLSCKTVTLRIKVKRRVLKKKVDYRYGGLMANLDSVRR